MREFSKFITLTLYANQRRIGHILEADASTRYRMVTLINVPYRTSL